MRLLVVGDVHGQLTTLHRIALRAWMQLGIDAIIQVGDFGFFPRVLVAYQRSWGRFPVPVHAIDGNHEDHAWLSRCCAQGETTEWPERLNLHYHPRGSVTHLDGVTIGWLGGALHTDRPQEGYAHADALRESPRPSNVIHPCDLARAITTWHVDPPDLLVTHTNPSGLGIGMRGNSQFAPQVAEVITAAGWDTGPPDDIGDPALTVVFRQLQPGAQRTLVFGHHHRWHRARIDHPAVGRVDACCVGSADGSDGHLGLWRTAVYDTRTRALAIGGRLPLLTQRCRSQVAGLLCTVEATTTPIPVSCIAAALGGKRGVLYRHIHRRVQTVISADPRGSGPMVVPQEVARTVLRQVLDSDVSPPEGV